MRHSQCHKARFAALGQRARCGTGLSPHAVFAIEREYMIPRLFCFAGGGTGPWKIVRMATIAGTSLPIATHLDIAPGRESAMASPRWTLRGITSNERYVERSEKEDLLRRQPSLGRPEATRAALIPIKKSPEWWGLTQDERRKIFEEQSTHIKIGLSFLPAIARRLHHCRDLGPDEPFDFLTWFEYAPSDEAAFDDLLVQLRRSPEWTFVTGEIDIRLEREP